MVFPVCSTTSEFVTRQSSSAPVFPHNTQAPGSIDSSWQAPTFVNYHAYVPAPSVRESVSVMNAGNVHGCEEETGRPHRILGPGGMDSCVEAVVQKETPEEMV